jgi:protein SCO1/2
VTVRRGISVVVVAAAFAAGCGAAGSSTPPAGAGLDASRVGELLHGGVLRPADVEPAIALTDTGGARYDIESRNPDKITLVYFGYTHCPDVCPTTMADIAQALRDSSAAVRRDVTVVFVTVDPHRDSRPVLRHWLNGFNRGFVGLRGTLRQVIAAQRAAGLPVSRVEANGKTIEHAAEVLAYTPDHLAHVIYFEGPSTIEDLGHDLPILVSASASAYGAQA